MKFIRKDTPTIMSGFVVRYILDSNPYDGEINASRDGVGVAGRWPIMSTESCVLFEETMARARVHARHLHNDHDRLFGERIQALTDEEVDRILSPIPRYEAAE